MNSVLSVSTNFFTTDLSISQCALPQSETLESLLRAESPPYYIIMQLRERFQ